MAEEPTLRDAMPFGWLLIAASLGAVGGVIAGIAIGYVVAVT